MNTESTQSLTSAPPVDVPRLVRSACKRPKSEVDKESLVKFRATTTAEALPNASFRLAHLTDADAQFTRLLDHLQSMGIPMGSETWATKALNRIRHLEDIHRATMRLLREYKGAEEVERLREDITRAREMLAKVTPPIHTMCDYCGWPGARAVGNGWAACEDCMPNESSQDRRPGSGASQGSGSTA